LQPEFQAPNQTPCKSDNMFSVFILKLLAPWDIKVKKGYENYNTKGKRRVIIERQTAKGA